MDEKPPPERGLVFQRSSQLNRGLTPIYYIFNYLQEAGAYLGTELEQSHVSDWLGATPATVGVKVSVTTAPTEVAAAVPLTVITPVAFKEEAVTLPRTAGVQAVISSAESATAAPPTDW